MTLTVTIDRLEGPMAVLEVGDETVDWPRSALPPDVAEGDRLQLTLQVCPTPSTEEAEARLQRLRARSPEDDGEIDL